MAGVVPLGDPVGFPVLLGDEGVLVSAGDEGLPVAGPGLLDESGDPVLEGFPLSAGGVGPGEVSPGALSLGALSLGELVLGELELGELSPGELVLGELSLGTLGPGELSPGELGLGLGLGLGELSPGAFGPGELSPGEPELGELSPGELGLGELSLGELELGEVSPGDTGLGEPELGEPSPDGVPAPVGLPSPGLPLDGELSPGEEGEPVPEGWVALSPLGVDGVPADAGAVEPGVPVDPGESPFDEPGSPVLAGLVGEPVSPNPGTVGAAEFPLPCRLDSNPLCTPPAPALVNVSTPISSLKSCPISNDAALADATCADRSAPSSVAAPAADLAAIFPSPEVTLSPTPPSLSPRDPPTAPPTAPPKVAKPRSDQPKLSIDRSPLATWMVRASASIPPSSSASNAAPRSAARDAALAIPRAIIRVSNCFIAIFTAT
ncbi:hypothetical protein [Nocardia salmonicida]|uniref:hypothetical protein n=1 Tax=Nocardia salmonicida TaxID=53431 RepID=UPI0033FC1824